MKLETNKRPSTINKLCNWTTKRVLRSSECLGGKHCKSYYAAPLYRFPPAHPCDIYKYLYVAIFSVNCPRERYQSNVPKRKFLSEVSQTKVPKQKFPSDSSQANVSKRTFLNERFKTNWNRYENLACCSILALFMFSCSSQWTRFVS